MLERESTMSWIVWRLMSCQNGNVASSTKPKRPECTSGSAMSFASSSWLPIRVPSLRTHGIFSLRRFQTRERWPPGRSTRAISGSACSRSNQWKDWAATTTSTERSGTGSSSAEACVDRVSGRLRRRMSSISWAGSVAWTSWPRATSCSVSLPVPAPTSRTVAGVRADQPPHRLGRERRAAAVVGLGHRAERTRESLVLFIHWLQANPIVRHERHLFALVDRCGS